MKKVFRNFLLCIPSFRRFGLISRVIMTWLLAGICLSLFYAKLDQSLPIIRGMLSFSPLEYANGLYEENRPRPALNYLEFYTSIPGASTPELEELKKQLELETQSFGYHFNQVKNGVKGKDYDEDYAGAIDHTMEFFAVGDVRTLFNEWSKHSNGEELDTLSASLAGIGLALSISEFFPAMIPVAEPLKKTTALLRKSLATISASMRKSLLSVIEPLLKRIRKSGLMADINFNSLANISELAKRQAGRIDDLTVDFKRTMSELEEFASLCIKHPDMAKLVAEHSSNVTDLKKYARVAAQLEREGVPIIKYGGRDALEAAASLERRGALQPEALKTSLRYGDHGLKAVAKGKPLARLAKIVELLKASTSFMTLFIILWLLSQLPWFVALCIIFLLSLVIFKTWCWKYITKTAAFG